MYIISISILLFSITRVYFTILYGQFMIVWGLGVRFLLLDVLNGKCNSAKRVAAITQTTNL